MAVETNGFDSRSREESMSSEETYIQKLPDTDLEDNKQDQFEDHDSGAESDEFDLLDLSETGEEFCQIGDQTCSIPFELLDLSGLEDILSMDVWNNVLSDKERLSLTKYLPDMDQETFLVTMKELFTGSNFHFGVPIMKLFDMLKGGLCEPRVSIYRQGLRYFQKRSHYHVVRNHHNTMVNNFFHMKDAWMHCKGYSIEEKLRVLYIVKNEKTLMFKNHEEQETESSDWEDYSNLRSKKRLKSHEQNYDHYPKYLSSPTFGKQLALEPANYRSGSVLRRQSEFRGVHRDHKFRRNGDIDKSGKKFEGFRGEDCPETHVFGRNRTVNQLSNIKMLTANPSNSNSPYCSRKKFKHSDDNHQIPRDDPVKYRKFRGSKSSQKDSQREISANFKGIDNLLQVDHIMNQENGRTTSMQNAGRIVDAAEGMKMLAMCEETESDSSEYFGKSDHENPSIKSVQHSRENDFVVDEITAQNGINESLVIETMENKSQKKPITLITPTIHTGFSFSIIHLLSAVRMALITILPEDTNSIDPDLSNSMNLKAITPSLTVQEIVNRVKSNPGDPCILETQEPLHDLVRGVLKLFSSKSAPIGVKGWKSLVIYEKSTKTWSWIGPISPNSSHHEALEVTSSDFWNLPYKLLQKLVDSFANWLKNGQDTLQQIGSLPAPPLMNVNLNEKERFRDLKAQKSLTTITKSSEEIKNYFRKEEILRYSIPDRAFAYTALDGRKSTVAPSKKGAGKPTSKARDHFMLKSDRPPHVTILCLVRDAAARLPGSIGTRADVCTLIRDSQYIVEDVSDTQVNQVVSGALDRLHYEQDPCVQFDGERKLWVYLHREREEDFEVDATSSTKKWKKQKKESVEPLENNEKKEQLEGNIVNHVSGKGDVAYQSPSVTWQHMGLDNLNEIKLLSSTNEDLITSVS